MGFKEVLQRMAERKRRKKEMLKGMDDELRFRKIVEDRQKSSNERELEVYMDEDREYQIKVLLEKKRKERERDINFNHNPLDAENITTKTDWEVLKEKNQFTGNGNMFANQPNIHKSNKKLLKNDRNIIGGVNLFKI